MHIVKCVFCQEKFDRDKEKYQEIGYRRYAHLRCHEPKIDVDGTAYNMIIQYCSQIFGEKANFKRIGKQIKDFILQGMTYKGIYLSLKYWYDVKKNRIERSNGGIGIVPYIYKEASAYWKQIGPKRVPKIEQEEVVITYRKRKSILESLEG